MNTPVNYCRIPVSGGGGAGGGGGGGGCPLEPHPISTKFRQGGITKDCAGGTVFNLEACGCIFPTQVGATGGGGADLSNLLSGGESTGLPNPLMGLSGGLSGGSSGESGLSDLLLSGAGSGGGLASLLSGGSRGGTGLGDRLAGGGSSASSDLGGIGALLAGGASNSPTGGLSDLWLGGASGKSGGSAEGGIDAALAGGGGLASLLAASSAGGGGGGLSDRLSGGSAKSGNYFLIEIHKKKCTNMYLTIEITRYILP